MRAYTPEQEASRAKAGRRRAPTLHARVPTNNGKARKTARPCQDLGDGVIIQAVV